MQEKEEENLVLKKDSKKKKKNPNLRSLALVGFEVNPHTWEQ